MIGSYRIKICSTVCAQIIIIIYVRRNLVIWIILINETKSAISTCNFIRFNDSGCVDKLLRTIILSTRKKITFSICWMHGNTIKLCYIISAISMTKCGTTIFSNMNSTIISVNNIFCITRAKCHCMLIGMNFRKTKATIPMRNHRPG